MFYPTHIYLINININQSINQYIKEGSSHNDMRGFVARDPPGETQKDVLLKEKEPGGQDFGGIVKVCGVSLVERGTLLCLPLSVYAFYVLCIVVVYSMCIYVCVCVYIYMCVLCSMYLVLLLFVLCVFMYMCVYIYIYVLCIVYCCCLFDLIKNVTLFIY